MSRDVTTAAAPRGRPRSEKAQNAILEAAAELLLEQGLAAVSMDAVAARAGVSKATIYRWWPTKETLALDALYHEWASVPPAQDTGALRGEAQTDPAFAREYRARFLEPRRDQARTILRRAIGRGEIPADTKIEVALDLLYGPIYHRLLHGHAPLNDKFVRDVIDTALDGIAPGLTQP